MNMNNEKIRIVVAGCGSIGLRHLKNLKRNTAYSLELAALDPSPRAAEEVAAVGTDIEFLPDWEAVRRWRPEIVIVATPNHLHKQNTLDALALGAHVLCEKPVACSAEDARIMAEAARRADRVLGVGQTERFRKAAAEILRMTRAGRLGTLIGGRAMVGTYNTLLCAKDKRHRQEHFGTIVIDYVHELDLLHAVFSPAVSAKGYCNSLSKKELQADPTLAAALIRYENGEVVSLHLDYVQHPERRVFEIFGDRGTLVYDFSADRLEIWDPSGKAPECLTWGNVRDDQFVREHLDMISAVRNGTAPLVTADEAAEVLETAELILTTLKESVNV